MQAAAEAMNDAHLMACLHSSQTVQYRPHLAACSLDSITALLSQDASFSAIYVDAQPTTH